MILIFHPFEMSLSIRQECIRKVEHPSIEQKASREANDCSWLVKKLSFKDAQHSFVTQALSASTLRKEIRMWRQLNTCSCRNCRIHVEAALPRTTPAELLSNARPLKLVISCGLGFFQKTETCSCRQITWF